MLFRIRATTDQSVLDLFNRENKFCGHIHVLETNEVSNNIPCSVTMFFVNGKPSQKRNFEDIADAFAFVRDEFLSEQK